ncbi:hypothetical protein C4J81_00145 [Deltaproteobacteria bacterium Smac51]|nr:hypothetical protein C4J81_00145 [Deltaproteobacteria bacterium Smac51]
MKPEYHIHQRPKIVEKRGRLGDWEIDTLLGGRGGGGLVSAVDRKSRYLVLTLISNKSAAEAERAICLSLPAKTVKMITMDNGSEFANFKNIQKRLKAKVYFAAPHSPWQRGSIENINGLIRWFSLKDMISNPLLNSRSNWFRTLLTTGHANVSDGSLLNRSFLPCCT